MEYAEYIQEDRVMPDDDYPCNACIDRDRCDGWEARFCCTLCRYDNADPDCDNCDPWDI